MTSNWRDGKGKKIIVNLVKNIKIYAITLLMASRTLCIVLNIHELLTRFYQCRVRNR